MTAENFGNKSRFDHALDEADNMRKEQRERITPTALDNVASGDPKPWRQRVAQYVSADRAVAAITEAADAEVKELRAALAAERAPAQPDPMLEPLRMTAEEIDIIWKTMPGGPGSWLKGFGYQQFAKAIEDEVILNHQRAAQPTAPQAAPDDEAINEMRIALTVQLDSLIDVADRYARRIQGKDHDEHAYVIGAISRAMQVASPYKYNGKYRDAAPQAAVELPPLPEPEASYAELDDFGNVVSRKTGDYTAEQVRQAQRDAIASAKREWEADNRSCLNAALAELSAVENELAASRSAATPADLSDLTRYTVYENCHIAEGHEIAPEPDGEYLRFDDVQKFFATESTAAPADLIADRQYLAGYDAGFMAGATGDDAAREAVHTARRRDIREFLATNRAAEGEARDPLDMPLPCDVKIGAVTIRKGCKLRTLVRRAESLHRMLMEHMPKPTPEQRAAFEALIAAPPASLDSDKQTSAQKGGSDA